ncbi:MAG TPA: FG-GAP-like repeat-containing protein [Bryobacteraceae bacterium]|nr:FG-GAP-like repeat-containing protein [Bryobacteraceae bacterium]
MRAVQPSHDTGAPVRRHWGRRHRRIAWTGGVLATAALIGGLVSWKAYRESRPEEYVPGEASAEITTSIAEKGSHEGAGSQAVPRIEVGAARKADPLRDPGRVLPPGGPPPRFTDVTAAAGLAGFRTFAGKRSSQLPEDMGGGVAWGDFDNDGFDDLFVVSAGGEMSLPADRRAPSMLFRNRGDGTFERVQNFPDLRIQGMGVAWGDYNNDGWLDLVVTGFNTLLLFRNDHGVLKRDTSFPSPEGFWTGASWGDYDLDGRLDLYVCGYVRYAFDEKKAATSSQQFGLEVPYTLNPASFDAERNLLFHNLGNGRFEEVAKALGVQNPEGRSLSALWHDFDGDGWPDLYVANDISENKFFLNRHGKFVDSGHGAWIAEYRGSMGLAAGDFDRDGDDDLFISHWIAQQFALYESLAADNRKSGLGANGSPALRFTDVAEATGIGPPSLQKIGWGAAFADFDSDGWLDLAVANGSTFETKDAQKRLVPMESFLFWNSRGRFFHDLAPWNRSLGGAHVSRGLAVADYDNDGALDIAIVDLDGGVRLLRNDLPHGNWIEFRLQGRGAKGRGGFPDGAVVTVWAGGKRMHATVSSASYLSQNSRRVHFGLGASAAVDKLEVRWPDGKSQFWPGLDANRIWDLSENAADAAPFTPGTAQVTAHLSREQTARFWQLQRAAMDAMKRSNDTAAALFREALALNPAHEDSRYYLANCLAARGEIGGAIAELERLASINPQSHRAWQRRGVLLAGTGSFAAARSSLDRAHRINPEESGTLLLLAEVDLAQKDLAAAGRRLQLALRMNPKSVGGLFLSAYTSWKRSAAVDARAQLSAAQAARGPDWKPKGSVAEGDVKARMFSDAGFLAPYWERWDGASDPRAAFAEMDRALGNIASVR